jgi:hypothetical protein
MIHLRRLQDWTQDPARVGGNIELDEICADVAGLDADLTALASEVGGDLSLLARLGWLPVLGPNLKAAPHLLEMGVQLTRAADEVCLAAKPLIAEVLSGGMTGLGIEELGSRALAGIQAQQPHWVQMAGAVEAAVAARDRFTIHDMHPRLKAQVARLDRGLPWLRAGSRAMIVAPEMLGASGPRHYLILAQNNDELRATGGYISGVGLLVLEQAQIKTLTFQDSYAVDDLSKDHPAPPEAMQKLMGIELWMLRDTNWFPHFPDSARAAADIYYLDQGVAVDGVIAADMTALQRIVEALEPLRMVGYEQEITGENVLPTLQSYWAPQLEPGQTWEEWEAIPWEVRKKAWFDNRKDFMPDLMDAIQERVFADPASVNWERLFWAVQETFDEKHALAFVYEPQLQEALRIMGWAGAQVTVPHDYLMVVDTNVGYTKVNPNIQERISYTIDIQDNGQVQANVHLSYHNTSDRDIEVCIKDMSYDPTYELMTQRCYWDYLRLFVPPEAELLSVRGPRPAQEAEDSGPYQAWATSFLLPPRERTAFHFTYRLPSDILVQDGVWTYNLLVQKQAGTNARPLDVTVRLPQDARIVHVEPEPARIIDSQVQFTTDLRMDREIEIIFRP